MVSVAQVKFYLTCVVLTLMPLTQVGLPETNFGFGQG